MTRAPAIASVAIAVLVTCSCLSNGKNPGHGSEPESPARSSAPVFFTPAPQDRVRTTNGVIFLGNLNASIDTLSDRLADQPAAALEQLLAGQLHFRFQILGRLDDLESAAALIRQVTNEQPNPAAWMLQARIHAAFHRFSEALAILGRLDASQPEIDPTIQELRRNIVAAQAGITSVPKVSGARPTMQSLATEAMALLDQGRMNEAMARFHLAEAAYQGANPYPLALLHSQVGIGFMRYKYWQEARIFLESALSRLPGYVLAKDHLAETLVQLGDTNAAIVLYLELVESTDDPEFCGLLEGLYEQQRFARCARTGFSDRLLSHPEAYWNHAAEYYLARGEPRRALELARLNAETRSDPQSMMLLARAAQADDLPEEMCSVVLQLQSRTPKLPELSQIDFTICNHC